MPDGRWVFNGTLNGWNGLNLLEVLSITSLVASGMGHKIERTWKAADQTGEAPTYPSGHNSVRVTLRAAPWTAAGWSRRSPGWVLWYFAMNATGPRLDHGEDIIRSIQQVAHPPKAVCAHLLAHRFAKRVGVVESVEDKITYHANVILEWDHGQHMTVIELGRLNITGAARGKSTWYPPTVECKEALASALPSCMHQPWVPQLAEIRCSDVPATNIEQLRQYVDENTGPGKYFIDPQWQYTSQAVRLHHRTQEDIARYLLNYMGRDRRYSKVARNCQLFAADFFSFLAGKKNIEPYSAIMRATYICRSHLFLYDPSMYDTPEIEM